ncbi:MAG: hypothetical protein EAZ16_03095 [Sphingobacteriales bacterium]|nr:MAG: hypothetical protein EAZ16_03095 [Sphingobacteriales bacterium]
MFVIATAVATLSSSVKLRAAAKKFNDLKSNSNQQFAVIKPSSSVLAYNRLMFKTQNSITCRFCTIKTIFANRSPETV